MSARSRFRYPLQAVLVLRQWDLETLLRDLAELNLAMASKREQCAALREQLALASREWTALVDGARILSIDHFSRLARYAGERERLVGLATLELERIELDRDGLLGRIASVQRAVETLEKHREKDRLTFVRGAMSGELRRADEQWTRSQAGGAGHDR